MSTAGSPASDRHEHQLAFAAISNHSASTRDHPRPTAKRPCSVTLHRITLGLLQPLLALLLMAGLAQAEPRLCADDTRSRTAIEHSAKQLDATFERIAAASVAEQAELAPTQDDPSPDLHLSSAQAAPARDEARHIRTTRAAHPQAPPQHRANAHPSTGPPLV